MAFLEALASGIPMVASRITSFAFASGFPGVQLWIPRIRSVRERARDALHEPRVERSLDGLTLNDTAQQYQAITRRVAGALA